MTYQITVNPARTGQGYGTSIFSEWAVNKEVLARQIKRDIIFEDDTSVFQTARSVLNVANARGYPVEIITVIKIKGKPTLYTVRSISELEKLPGDYRNYKYFIRVNFKGAP